MVSSNFPSGWAQVYLENVVEILDSMRVPVNSDDRSSRVKNKSQSQLYPYYGATGEVGKIDGYIFDEELVALGEDGVPFFDARKAKAYLLQGKTWVNNHAHVLKAKEQVAINKYILHYLNQFDYQGYVNGGTRLKLTQANMRKIPIVLAPLSEQKIIVIKLDDMLAKVERIKARLERIPQILKKLRQSVLADAVSGKLTEDWRLAEKPNYEVSELGRVARFIDYRGKTPKKTSYGFPLITAKNIRQGFLSLEPREFISEKDYESWMTRGIPKYGDVLITTEAPMGFVANVNITEKFALAQRAICLQFQETVNPYYASIFMQTSEFQMALNSYATGTTVKGIKASLLKKIKIRHPSLREQNEIVRRVNEIFEKTSQTESRAKLALDKASRLPQSILAKAFSGDLTKSWRESNMDLISGDNSAQALLMRIKDEKTKSDNSKKAMKMSINLPLPPLDIRMRAIVSINKILKVKDAFNVDSSDEDHILSGQELLLAAGYPNDADAETLEKFYLDLRDSLDAGEIIKLNRGDEGQDWFALAKYLEK